jgi:hypothetical protein
VRANRYPTILAYDLPLLKAFKLLSPFDVASGTACLFFSLKRIVTSRNVPSSHFSWSSHKECCVLCVLKETLVGNEMACIRANEAALSARDVYL